MSSCLRCSATAASARPRCATRSICRSPPGVSLTGEHVFLRCRVLLLSFEDDIDELRRRIKAACLHHGIRPVRTEGLAVFCRRRSERHGKLMLIDQKGRQIVGALAEKIETNDVIRHSRPRWHSTRS